MCGSRPEPEEVTAPGGTSWGRMRWPGTGPAAPGRRPRRRRAPRRAGERSAAPVAAYGDLGDEGGGGVERLVGVDRGEVQGAGQGSLGALERVEEENADEGEGEDRARMGGPAHLGGRVGADGPVDPALGPQVTGGGVDACHVVAEGAVRQGQRRDEREQLEQTGEEGLMPGSEPLRVEEGEDEVAQQGDGHDQADHVLGGHSLATARATRATSAKTAIVVATKAVSAIVCSWGVRFLGPP
ncbi:hypothetical protein JHY03_55000 [Streptomyces sp. CA-256286]|nr:hypothetical protein JHY03_55000 [Streptomyces sp. CA-256286]